MALHLTWHFTCNLRTSVGVIDLGYLNPQLENETKDFLDLSFLMRGQSGSGQAAQSDQVIAIP